MTDGLTDSRPQTPYMEYIMSTLIQVKRGGRTLGTISCDTTSKPCAVTFNDSMDFYKLKSASSADVLVMKNIRKETNPITNYILEPVDAGEVLYWKSFNQCLCSLTGTNWNTTRYLKKNTLNGSCEPIKAEPVEEVEVEEEISDEIINQEYEGGIGFSEEANAMDIEEMYEEVAPTPEPVKVVEPEPVKVVEPEPVKVEPTPEPSTDEVEVVVGGVKATFIVTRKGDETYISDMVSEHTFTRLSERGEGTSKKIAEAIETKDEGLAKLVLMVSSKAKAQTPMGCFGKQPNDLCHTCILSRYCHQ